MQHYAEIPDVDWNSTSTRGGCSIEGENRKEFNKLYDDIT